MFKNLSAFAYNPSFRPSLAEAIEAVEKQSFLPCGPTQRVSVGFTAPRHLPNSPLVESHQKHWFLEVTIEKRDLPGAVVNRHLEERLQDILDKTGRKPGAKAKKAIKEELVLELLPKAFTKIETLTLWLDPTRHLLSIDTCSKSKVELVTGLLCSTFPGFYLKPLNTAQSVSACTSAWLLDGEPHLTSPSTTSALLLTTAGMPRASSSTQTTTSSSIRSRPTSARASTPSMWHSPGARVSRSS